KPMKRRRLVLFASWWARTWRHGLPCVGLIVLLGSFTFLIAPDDEFTPGPHNAGPGTLAVAGPPMVVVDPGHGGIDEGTKYYGLAEKDMTLDVAGRLQQLLNHAHVATVLTRHEDVYVSLPER